MFTKSSRGTLCFFLTILMVVGICLFVISTLIRSTLCTPMYMEKFLSSNQVTEYCNEAFEQRMALLAENSGIPIRVFDASDNVGGYSETVVERFYDGSDTSMLTKDKITVYENLIVEFLEGNGEAYDSSNVHNTAVRAAEIYADCYGIKNIDTLRLFVNDTISCYNKLSSAGMVIVLISFLLMISLFDNKKKAFLYFSSAFSAAGLSFIFIGVACLIVCIGKGGVITPVIYSNAIFKSINVMLIILIVFGVILSVVSMISSIGINKRIKSKRDF